jgi:replicative DNA helicase
MTNANTLPHDINAEQAIIKEILNNFEIFVELKDIISSSDFYFITHKVIFDIATLFEQSTKRLDYVTLIHYAGSSGKLEGIGGVGYINSIMEANVPGTSIEEYAKIIKSCSKRRELIQISQEIANTAYQPKDSTTEQIIDGAQKKILSVNMDSHEDTFTNARELSVALLNNLQEAASRKDPIMGVRTHYEDFDEKTLGFQSGDLIIISGRPSMGKTVFSLNCVLNAAAKGGKAVAVFSLEMPKEQLGTRMLSALSGVDYNKIKKGQMSEHEWPNVTIAFKKLQEIKFYIDDEGGVTPSQIRSRARKLKRDHGIDIILIDYLQLMNPDTKNTKDKNNEIGEITKSLKALAKELKVPIIVLSQLNRNLEQRPDKRPKNSDLRDSGNIEQDADLIIHLYRDEVYNPDTEDKDILEVIIGKQRNGEIGTVLLKSELRYQRFKNLTSNNGFDSNYDNNYSQNSNGFSARKKEDYTNVFP